MFVTESGFVWKPCPEANQKPLVDSILIHPMFLCQQESSASLVLSLSAENCKGMPVCLREYVSLQASSVTNLSVMVGD